MYLYTNKTEIIPLGEKLPKEGYEVVTTFTELNGKNWLLYNKEQSEFYEANPTATPEEVYNMRLTVYIPLLDELKVNKIAMIEQADKEASVFYVNGMPMWLDKELRNSLLNVTLPALQAAGETTAMLWYEGVPPIAIPVPIDILLQAIPALELYATVVYNRTQELKALAYNAQTEQALNEIEITGYPTPLTFEL